MSDFDDFMFGSQKPAPAPKPAISQVRVVSQPPGVLPNPFIDDKKVNERLGACDFCEVVTLKSDLTFHKNGYACARCFEGFKDITPAQAERVVADIQAQASAAFEMFTPPVVAAVPATPKRTNSDKKVDSAKPARAASFGPIVPPDASPPEQPVEREQTGIDKLGLPSAAVKALMRNGYETLADLRKNRIDIPSVRGVGQKSVDAIMAILDKDAPPAQEAPEATPPAKATLQLVALPIVVTVGKVAIIVEPESMRTIDLDSIVGGAPNAVEVTQRFLETTPLDAVKPTRLHVLSSAEYADAVVNWARANNIPVFGVAPKNG